MKRSDLLVAAALAILGAPFPEAHAQASISVALVLDVEGTVRLVRGKDVAKAGVTSDIFGDTRVEVESGGRVVMLVLVSGDEATLRGPASANAAGGSLISNPVNALTSRKSSVGNVKLRKRDLSQAAIVMRSDEQTVRFPLLSLAGTLTLDRSPLFRWRAIEGVGPYRFTLMDEAGNELFAMRTDETEARLPGAIALVEGRAYTWEVRARRANGLEFSNFGDFSLAPASLRAQALDARPATGAGFAERVAYAVWLDSVELVDAARQAWRALAAERPGDERLVELAGP